MKCDNWKYNKVSWCYEPYYTLGRISIYLPWTVFRWHDPRLKAYFQGLLLDPRFGAVDTVCYTVAADLIVNQYRRFTIKIRIDIWRSVLDCSFCRSWPGVWAKGKSGSKWSHWAVDYIEMLPRGCPSSWHQPLARDGAFSSTWIIWIHWHFNALFGLKSYQI